MAEPFLALITPLGAPPAQPPLGIWGPTDPRPTQPIAGWNPGTGTWPTPPVQPPLVIWGPGDPRPTVPIAGPGRPPNRGIAIRSRLWHRCWTGHLGGPGQPFPTNPIAEPPWGWRVTTAAHRSGRSPSVPLIGNMPGRHRPAGSLLAFRPGRCQRHRRSEACRACA